MNNKNLIIVLIVVVSVIALAVGVIALGRTDKQTTNAEVQQPAMTDESMPGMKH